MKTLIHKRLEFLCLAEGGEVTHYEVLASIAKDVTNKKFGTTVNATVSEVGKNASTEGSSLLNQTEEVGKKIIGGVQMYSVI